MDAPAAPAHVVRVGLEPIDVSAETDALTAGRTDIGAVVAFTGLCRDEGGRLSVLELEHYPGMAEAEIGRIAAQAITRWPLMGLRVVHRSGPIRPGETIVLVAAASAHRGDAFEAASFLLYFLNTRARFWKKEHLADGTSGGWVEAKSADDAAAGRWD